MEARRQVIARETPVNELTARITGIDMDALIEDVRRTGVEYGLLKNEIDDLEHHRKIVIARLVEKHREDQREKGNTKPTVQQLDNLARADQEYAAFLIVLKAAKDRLTHKETAHFAKRNKLDVLLEQMKLARAEMHYLQQSSQTL